MVQAVHRFLAASTIALVTACGGTDDSALHSSSGSGNGGGGTSGDTGGSTGSGGSGGITSAGGSAAGGAGNACGAGQKLCSGACVSAGPEVGCERASCSPCFAPAHSVATCAAGVCSFACEPGYFAAGDSCFQDFDGGSGGFTGAGGATSDGGFSIDGGTGSGGQGGLTNCPATQPANGDICVSFSLNCSYGAASCACLLVFMLPVWVCR